jgi:tetratricopeptide (TPR) repeat protein
LYSLTFFSVLAFFVLGEERRSPDTVLEDGLQESEQWIAEGRFSEAIAALTTLKQIEPADPRPYFYSGIAMAELRQLTAAVEEFEEALRLDPSQAEYAVALANVAARISQDVLPTKTAGSYPAKAREVLAVFNDRKKMERLSKDWLWLLSQVYYLLNQGTDAAKVLALYEERYPEDVRIGFRKGQICRLRGDLERAESALRQAIQEFPEPASAYFELSLVLLQADRLNEAEEALAEAVSQDPDNVGYLYELAQLRLSLGKPEKAISLLEQVESMASPPSTIYRALGEAYRESGDLEKSAAYLERFRQLTSDQTRERSKRERARVLVGKGRTRLEEGDIVSARTNFEKALDLAPEDWLIRAYLVETGLALGDAYSQDTYEHLQKLEELDPISLESNMLMAVYWYQQEHHSRALTYAQKAKKIRPANAEVRNLLGNIHYALGAFEKALNEYAVATNLDPDRWDYRANHDSVLRKLGLKPPKHSKGSGDN